MFYIKIAVMAFKCYLCGTLIRRGDAYIQNEAGDCTCFCSLPIRRLKPINRTEHAIEA
jgi:hypothetical protein